MAEYNEKEALALLAKGDERGFKAIYDRYARSVFAICNKILKDEDAAEDVVHELFMRIWHRDREIISQTQDLHPYILKSAKNLTLKVVRRLKLRYKTELAYVSEFAGDKYNEDENKLAFVMKAVDRLPPQQKQVFTLGHLNGLSHNQIALQLGINARTVNNHMGLALKSIRAFVLADNKAKEQHHGEDHLAKIIELNNAGWTNREIATVLKIKKHVVIYLLRKTQTRKVYIHPSQIIKASEDVINALPPKLKQAILMRQAGVAAKEIAKELGVSKTSIYNFLSLGQKRIQELKEVRG